MAPVKRKRRALETPSVPRLLVPRGAEFRPEWIDFQRGIRVGRLDPHQRITRILKAALESGFGEPFVTVRWGRGVYWQWIGWFPRANRLAKPLSSHVSFGCAKYFISMVREESAFKAGMQVERGFLQAPDEYPESELRDDWDWHRLLAQLKPHSQLERLLRRLVRRDGFRLFAGSWTAYREVTPRDFQGARQLRRMLTEAPPDDWCGFQLFYPLREEEVRSMTGMEVIEAILAVFSEVTPIMNRCMHIRLGPR